MIKNCKNCGKQFEVRQHRKITAKFCCCKCRGIWNYLHGINLPPKQNGKSPWNKGLTKKDDERINRFSKDRIGKNNPNWNGGITGRFRDRFKKELIKWRNKVFIRDKFICRKCGKVGGQLHPHHIKPVCINPEFAFNIDNGITLCVECHKKEHKLLSYISKKIYGEEIGNKKEN